MNRVNKALVAALRMTERTSIVLLKGKHPSPQLKLLSYMLTSCGKPQKCSRQPLSDFSAMVCWGVVGSQNNIFFFA